MRGRCRPYFRIFNPVLQGRKFDPDGAYIRRWVPELARLPDDALHAPWETPPLLLLESGVQLGKNIPGPSSTTPRRATAPAALSAMKEA
ncbi:MAG: FAD-binding domain-containing protein [Kiritimatiellia bacterium]